MPESVTLREPEGLGTGGSELWRAITETHDLDPAQVVQLEEACRAKDRLDRLDLLLRGDVETWARLVHKTQTNDYELKIDDALAKANATANLMKQLLAALRLPDEQTGQRPQRRSARGAYKPRASAKDRLKASVTDERVGKLMENDAMKRGVDEDQQKNQSVLRQRQEAEEQAAKDKARADMPPKVRQAVEAAETGEGSLAFFDAIAPIVHRDSIDMDVAWMAARWDRGSSEGGGKDYVNCPLDKAQYEDFVQALVDGEKMPFKEWETDTPYFEGCMPIEVMAERGPETLRHGPMKPMGPAAATARPTSSETVTMATRFSICTSTPRWSASASPST